MRYNLHSSRRQAEDREAVVDPKEIAETVIKRLEEAWNAADGAAFGESFAPDADFVAIRGDWHSGEEIAAGHQQLFDTIYAGSTVRYTVLRARSLDDNVILAHVRGTLNAPTGPLAGESEALASVVLVGEGGDHRIAALPQHPRRLAVVAGSGAPLGLLSD
jgi:uncharacterized protein (TIGR02246 family)